MASYLQKLRKPQLVELAEASDLQDHDEYNKPELATALDEHLRANRSIFGTDSRFAEYYRRQSNPGRLSSPVKRESEEGGAAKPSRRKATKAKEEAEPTDDSDGASGADAKSPTAARTPARSALSVRQHLPPSPAVVTDAIDHHTAQWRRRFSSWWTASGVEERSHAVRTTLSSLKAVQLVILALETYNVLLTLIPMRYLTTFPSIEAVRTPAFTVKIPDLFVLVDAVFWAPFALWLLTSLVLPLSVAYFFNLTLQVGVGPASGTRSKSHRVAQANFDPLSFNVAKALITYLVYAKRFNLCDLFSLYTIQRVNLAFPGQWAGIVTGAAIGGLSTLYDAILKK